MVSEKKRCWLQYQLRLLGYKLIDIQKATRDYGIESVKDFIEWIKNKDDIIHPLCKIASKSYYDCTMRFHHNNGSMADELIQCPKFKECKIRKQEQEKPIEKFNLFGSAVTEEMVKINELIDKVNSLSKG